MDSKRGWFVVLGSFLTLAITSGVGFFSLPILLDNIITDTGWTLTQVSASITVWGASAAIFSPLCGILIDRYGPRRMIVFGILLGMFAAYLTGRVNSLLQLYAIMCVASIAHLSCTFIPAATVVARWFIKRRGIATGVVMLGNGIGGASFPIFIHALLDTYNWREIYTALAGILSIALIPTLIWIRNPDPDEVAQYAASVGHEREVTESLTLRQAFTTRSFWVLGLGDMLTGLVFAIFNIHLVFYLTRDLNNADTATQVYSVLQLCLAGGVLVFGPLADRYSLRWVLFACYFLPALAAILLLPGGMSGLAFTFALIAGLAGGGRSALFPIALVYCFGKIHMAAIYGVSDSLFMIGNAAGPIVAATIYEQTGSPRAVYAASIAILVVSATLIARIRPEFAAKSPTGGWAARASLRETK